MRQLFCYTLSPHGRLAQRLAQVLYTHKAGGSNPSSPTTDLIGSQLWGPFLFKAHRRGIRTRKGAELRKRVSVFQRSTRGPQARSGSGRRSRTRHPSSPTTDLIGSQQWEPIFFGPSAWDSNPPARLSQRLWSKNGKYEYCYFVCNI